MPIKYIFFFFLCLFFNTLLSQTIKGHLKDQNNKTITISSSIILKEEDNSTIDYKVVYNGVFSFKIKNNYKSILLSVTVFGYEPYEKKLTNISIDEPINLEINLIKTTTLDEVIIKSKKRFTSLKDTIRYNIDAYKNGTERKLIDVIKKLPGIAVNPNNGKIKYNGKPIETVLLEGDNLFGGNYTVGTKNINIDIIKNIEAINKYSKNPLLKDIENSDKVVLNLILKNKMIDLSGNSDAELGLFNDKIAANLNTNLIGLTKKNKFFSVLSYNNIGNNHTPFNYANSNIDISDFQYKNTQAPKIISEFSLNQWFNDNRNNINNQFFANINDLITVNKKTKLKTNIFYLRDQIENNQYNESNYNIDNSNITTFDNSFVLKKPVQFRADFNLKNTPKKNSNLEYDLSITDEKITTPKEITSNNENNFTSKLKTKNLFLKQYFTFTKKVSKRKVYQLLIKNTFNNLNQNFNINTNSISTDFQNIESQKIYTELIGLIFGKDKSNNKYKITLGSVNEYLNLKSNLNNNSFNNNKYTLNKVYSSINYNFRVKKWSFNPSLSLKIEEQKLKYFDKTTNLIFNPSFKISYKINNVSAINSEITLDKTSNAANYLFKNSIQTSNRNSIVNIPNLSLTNSQNLNINYYNNNLYDQFNMNFSLNLSRLKGDFFSKLQINENTIQTTYFFLPEYNSNYNLNFDISKYISFLKSTFKITSYYSVNKFKNIINNSELRNNKSENLNLNLIGKTAFDGFINFENNFSYMNSVFKNNIPFSNIAINNTFKTIISPNNNWFSRISLDYYSPNINNSKTYSFLDFDLRYKKKKFNIGFTVKNILEVKEIEDIQVTDYSTQIFRSSILPRYFLVDFSFNF